MTSKPTTCSRSYTIRRTVGLPVRRPAMVLIIVSIVMALVSLSAMGFLISMKTENRSAHLQADAIQVQQLADSGVAFLQTLARLPREQRLAWGPLEENTTLFRSVLVDVDPVGQRHGRFSVLTPQYRDDSAIAELVFGIQDTSAKLALPTILLWDQMEPGRGRQTLMNLPGMNESLADALLDWIDADDETREFGAESEFYLGLEPPRQPPNRPPARIEDLLAVRGMTAWQLLGRQDGVTTIRTSDGDNNVSTTLDMISADSQPGQTWLTPAPPWSHFLTVRSATRNENASGEARVDLNQPNLSALRTALTNRCEPECVRFIMAYRQYGPAQIGLPSATTEEIPEIPLSQPGRYPLKSPLDLVDAVVQVPDTRGEQDGKPTAYASPFRTDEPASLEALVTFCDSATTETKPILEGRINVLTAPRSVLLGVPGLSSEQVESLLDARLSTRDDTSSRDHPVWLLAEGLADLNTMRQIWPYLNCGGDVFRAQIIAFYDAQSPFARMEIVVDGTSDRITPLYYRDLRRLGLGVRWSELMSPDAADRGESTETPLPFAREGGFDRTKTSLRGALP